MTPDLELLIAFLVPIRELLLNDAITEIMGNPDGSWWYEINGDIRRAPGVAFDSGSLGTAIEVIANNLGKKLESDHPILNVQLPDGSRFSAVLPPVVRPAPAITIRKFPKERMTVNDMVRMQALSPEVARRLSRATVQGKTMLISGGTGSGKTTLLNALADHIPTDERLVVIEDTSELRINAPNVLAAECQAASRGADAVTFDTLLKASLRWRPDRIILGEVRGEEARTLLDSFNTGHAGSMATIHASSAVKALHRFAELAMRSHQQANRDDICGEIAGAVELVVQIARTSTGRRVTEMIEVTGYDRVAKQFRYKHPIEPGE